MEGSIHRVTDKANSRKPAYQRPHTHARTGPSGTWRRVLRGVGGAAFIHLATRLDRYAELLVSPAARKSRRKSWPRSSMLPHYPQRTYSNPNHLRHQEGRGCPVSSCGASVLVSPSVAVSGTSRQPPSSLRQKPYRACSVHYVLFVHGVREHTDTMYCRE